MQLLSYDIESCSGGIEDASLCSFGYCLADDNFNIIKQEDILVNPAPKKFSLSNTYSKKKYIELAYPESRFREAPKFNKQYSNIASKFKGDILVVGYAVDNDVKYLNNACDYYHLKRIPFKFIDVAQIYMIVNNENHLTGLQDVAKAMEIEFVAHRSDEDARATLTILQKICAREELSLAQLLDKYEIIPGENKIDRTRPTYNKKYLDGRADNKRTKKHLDILYDVYDDGLKTPKDIKKSILSGKNIMLNDKLRYSDANYIRSLQKAMIEYGARLTEDTFLGNIYVSYKGCKQEGFMSRARGKNGQKMKIIYEDEFFKIIGDFEKLHFENDAETIVDYLEKNDQHALNSTRDYISGDSSTTLAQFIKKK